MGTEVPRTIGMKRTNRCAISPNQRIRRILYWFLRIFLGLFLLAAGAGKGVGIPGFVEVIETYRTGLPLWGRWAVAIAISLLETGLGLWILSGRRTAAGALVAFFLNIGYFALLAMTLLRGIDVPNCGCFGMFLPRPLTPETLLEDLLLCGFSWGLYLLARDERRSSGSGHRGSILRAVGPAVVGIAVLFLATFALPIRTWRTGELPAPPLPLTEGGSGSARSPRVWIDTDASCGSAGNADVDDCFALLLLARSPQIRIAGVSTVFGNAPIDVTDRTTRDLLATLGGEMQKPPPVYRGSPAPMKELDPGATAPAYAALRSALRRGRLTIVALGPLTNLAVSLRDDPDLQANVTSIVAVMGHRVGHLFHPAEGKGRRGILFGHGPVFRDFNFAQDRDAAVSIVEMRMPITLVPYDAARTVSLNAADLDRMAAAGGASGWVASRSRGWLRHWKDHVGLDGFYPFDLIAASYVVSPRRFRCARAAVWIAPDRMIRWLPAPDSLLAGLDHEKPKDVRASGEAVYCPQIEAGLGRWLSNLLTVPGGGH